MVPEVQNVENTKAATASPPTYRFFFPAKAELPALRLVQTPRIARRLAKLLLAIFLLTPVVLVFVPWQQTVTGKGRVIAFDPGERQQIVQAPIEGRVKKWHVEEGSIVKKGDLILEIEDNDPLILERLQTEFARIQDRMNETRDSAKALDKQVLAEIEARAQFLKAMVDRLEAGDQEIIAAKETVKGLDAVFTQAQLNHKRQLDLYEHPLKLASQLEVELAERAYKDAAAKVEAGKAAIARATSNRAALTADRLKGASDADAKIQKATSDSQKARADLASYERDLEPMKVRLDRQKTMLVHAPIEGTILRIQANAGQGGGFVKAGDRLADLVPKTKNRVVELWIDGNDAPLIPALMRAREREGAGADPVHVRLQFEGWPALQFAGWPSVSTGTFGGLVKLIDAADNGKGQFRILIEPDPNDDAWPSANYLRQGVRAQGWVMLNEVPLGWEVWRRLNGFPPFVANQEPDADKASKGSGK